MVAVHPPSPPAPLPGWLAAADPESLLRRALLRASQDTAVLQDLVDCAELALAADLRDTARVLYGLVFLHVGFSSEGLAFQEQVGRRSRLWSGPPSGSQASGTAPPAFSVEIAVAELQSLMRLRPQFAPPPDLASLLPPDEPPSLGTTARLRIADLQGRVEGELGEIPQLQSRGALGDMLSNLMTESLSAGPIALEDYLDQSTSALAALLALHRLQRLLLGAADLLAATPRDVLFQEAGRLRPGGLGPYFSNVRLVIRTPHDVFALIEAAAEGHLADADFEDWCVLLSSRMHPGELGDFAEELGDRGMTRALRRLLVRCARASRFEQHPGIVWRIRDAAIDLGDLWLAADAQRLVALWNRTNWVEWSILADILATLGDKPAAETTFERCLRLEPGNEGVRERVAALCSGSFSQFEISHGYLSSPARRGRRQTRLRQPTRASAST
jgi:hypothetical protein